MIPIIGSPAGREARDHGEAQFKGMGEARKPRLFLAHGDEDALLSHGHSELLRGVAEEKGVPVKCSVSKGAGHGFRGESLTPSVAEIKRRTVAFS